MPDTVCGLEDAILRIAVDDGGSQAMGWRVGHSMGFDRADRPGDSDHPSLRRTANPPTWSASKLAQPK
jgi:hypothetical protein